MYFLKMKIITIKYFGGTDMERTFSMIKPDGIQRGLVGEILKRFEKKGIKIAAMKFMEIDEELAEKHYEVHKGKAFYSDLIKFITSSPVLAMVFEGEDVINIVRKLVGATSPESALPGTVRGDYSLDVEYNLIHASDSAENAKREISLFFKEEEILNYELITSKWVYSD